MEKRGVKKSLQMIDQHVDIKIYFKGETLK